MKIILFLALVSLLIAILSIISKFTEYIQTSKGQSTVVEFIFLVVSAALFSYLFYLTH